MLPIRVSVDGITLLMYSLGEALGESLSVEQLESFAPLWTQTLERILSEQNQVSEFEQDILRAAVETLKTAMESYLSPGE